MPNVKPALSSTLLGMLLSACAAITPPPALPVANAVDADIVRLIAEAHASDARYQVLQREPYLMIDLATRYRLADYAAIESSAARREFICAFLQRAAAIGDTAVSLELARVPAPLLHEYAARHALPDAERDVREAVLADYRRRAAQALVAELESVGALAGTTELDAYWQALTSHIQASIMTRGRVARRLLTAPAVPFIAAWVAYHNWHDYRGPVAPDFAAQRVYSMAPAGTAPVGLAAADWDLLVRHAPIIVQEASAPAGYAERLDHFGEVSLTGSTADTASPAVATERPALYAYVDEKPLQGGTVRQLVYVLWYPGHPRLKRFDPEAGPLDGWTLRLTLDARERVQLVESVSNCGCYYKIFPSDALEAASAARHPDTLAGKRFHLEQHQNGRFDAIVPETIADLATGPRVVAYFSAGHHQLVSVRAASERVPEAQDSAGRYRLHTYDELEALPLAGQAVGLFGEDGLVRNADRQECALLTPSGVYHAGHPRQRGTQMIYFDEADFDDPRLLERYLRLPPGAFGVGA